VRLNHETLAAVNLYPELRIAGRAPPAGVYLGALRRGGVRLALVAPLGLGLGYATPRAVRCKRTLVAQCPGRAAQ